MGLQASITRGCSLYHTGCSLYHTGLHAPLRQGGARESAWPCLNLTPGWLSRVQPSPENSSAPPRCSLTTYKVLVLDEATASVDLETDALIQATLRSRLGGVSSLAIAHRLATLMHCDRVVVMSEGRAVEEGPPLELRETRGSRFAKLWAAHN